MPGEQYHSDRDSTTGPAANKRGRRVSQEYMKKARDCDATVPGDDTPFVDRLRQYGDEGRVLAPTVGSWCEVSETGHSRKLTALARAMVSWLRREAAS